MRLLPAILLLLPLSVLAQTQVPNVFEDGTPATAADVNENFDALETAIDAIPEGPAGPQGEKGDTGDIGPQGEQGETGPAGPQGATGLTGATGAKGDTGDQGIQGEQGPAGADGVAAGLSCTTDQIIVYRGGEWVCSSPEIVYEPEDSNTVSRASCPGEKQVVSGGCHFMEPAECYRLTSRPEFDLSG